MSSFSLNLPFSTHSDAEDAVHDLDGKDLLGDRLRVEIARGGNRGGRDGDRGGDRFGDRGGRRPGPRTNYRLVVDNLASRTSWQVG